MRNQKHTLIISLTAAAMVVALVAGVLYFSSHRKGAVAPPESTSAANAHPAGHSHSRGVAFSARSSSKYASARSHLSPHTAGKISVIPATIPQSALAKVKLPRGIAFAQIPWLNDPANPSPEFIVRAQLPWVSYAVAKLNIPQRRRKGRPSSKFVMALCRDRQGNIWIATEGSGIFRYNPAAPKDKRWTQFSKQNTQGQLANDNIYALACDNRGRIWAGELNHGISVYNGSRWQNYDIVQNPKRKVRAGPLGNHVFALKFDKYTDQMWACTDAGISIYQCSPSAGTVTRNPSPVAFAPGTWHYITQANGLPQNPDCVAFCADGTVYVGTQCDGIAVGTPDPAQSTNNIQQPTPSQKAAGSVGGGISNNDPAAGLPFSAPYTWRIVTGPWKMPLTAFGHGLPSNLINTISAAPNGELVAGTDGGIAFNKPASPAGRYRARSPQSWTFERGQDFPAKVLGLWHPPQHWQSPSPETLESLPMEDYTTAVAYSDQNNFNRRPLGRAGHSLHTPACLWLAHRARGIDVWQYSKAGKILKRLRIHEPQIGNYVTSLLPLPGRAMAVGTYGRGVSIITLPGAVDIWRDSEGGEVGFAVRDPLGAPAPTQSQIDALLLGIRDDGQSGQSAGTFVSLPDDWRTEGDWTGRYGRQFAELFAVCSPFSQVFTWDTKHMYRITPAMGLHHVARDLVRCWLQWRSSPSQRVLWDPIEGRRIEAEIDDHGETFSRPWQGPGLLILARLPAGISILSLYFFNCNGHHGSNRDRDYLVSLVPLPAGYQFGTSLSPNISPLSDLRGTARSRVVNFSGGVWKRFLVHGPARLAVRVAKNHSLNTILQGVFIDRVAGPHDSRSSAHDRSMRPLPWMGTVPYCAPSERALPATGRLRAIAAAWKRMRAAARFVATAPTAGLGEILVYRAAVAGGAPRWLLARWRWRIPLWTQSDRLTFTKTMGMAYSSLVARMTVTPWK